MRRFTALMVLAIGGCGSRSELVSGGDGGGAGGAAAGSTGGLGGSGGSSGSGGTIFVTRCDRLELVEPVLTVAGEPNVEFDDYLRFTSSSDDDRRVTGLFLRGQFGPNPVVHHVTLSPWELWPSSGVAEPVHTTELAISTLHVPSRSPGGRFAFAAGTEEGMHFIPSRDPVADSGPPYFAMALPGHDPMFVSPRAPGLAGPTHLVGTFDPPHTVAAQLVTENSLVELLPNLGCASTQPPSAAAVTFEDGWIAAVSTGAPQIGACDHGTIPDLPLRIDVVRVRSNGEREALASVATTSQVIDLSVAAHPDGAYVAWRTGIFSDPIWGLRIDRASNLTGPAPITDPTEISSAFAIASVGRWLGFARATPVGLRISVHDESLSELAHFDHELKSPFPTSAIGAPDGRGIVIGWKRSAEVQLARYDCGE